MAANVQNQLRAERIAKLLGRKRRKGETFGQFFEAGRDADSISRDKEIQAAIPAAEKAEEDRQRLGRRRGRRSTILAGALADQSDESLSRALARRAVLG